MRDVNTDESQERCPSATWTVRHADETVVAQLAVATGLSRVVARVMVARGIDTPEAAHRFLEPDLGRDWCAPESIPGMADAAEALAEAVRAGRRIVVFGDFDLDGISSAAVAARGLLAFGADARAIVPNRFTEGYGLSPAAIDRLLAMGAEVVVTVDCGISAGQEVDRLRAAGVDVIVTDHHEPGESVPVGVPVANPKLDPGSPSTDLAGAGVALKLIQATGERLGKPDVWRGLTDLATLGTIADIVPLLGENRALVADGVAAMRRAPRVAISALCAVAGTPPSELTADAVAFGLAPRLNAPGRMSDPRSSLELLLTDDAAVAEAAAQTLDEQNRLRQHTEQDLSAAALALADREHTPGERILVVAGEGWHEGVKGIVASRLTNVYGVPSILLAVDGDEAQGSGRSVGSVDLFAALTETSDLLVRFGGHAAAIGVTLKTADIPEFKRRISEVLAKLPSEQFEVARVVDAELDLEQLSVELATEFALLEPFGHSNPRPLFAARGVFMNARQRVGRTADHLRFTAFDGTISVPAIAFRCPDIESLAGHEAAVDLAFEMVADEWRGRSRVQMHVRDVVRRPRPEGYGPAADLVEDLFAHADEIIAREAYSGIEDADSFHTKLAGVTFEGRQDLIATLEEGTPLRLDRQPDNPHDPNAIALFEPRGSQVGFFNRRLSAALAPVIDAGAEYDVEVTDITGRDSEGSLGVNVLVSRRLEADDETAEETRLSRRATLARFEEPELTQELTRHFIGDRSLHAAQVDALAALERNERCLTVMATGRGKSLIFHLHAARIALKRQEASVFVFPLRALVADQAFHLEESMAAIGVRVATLTGESPPTVRDAVFADLAAGDLDIVLTTPEFLDHHATRFAAAGTVGFVVIDEAHHIAMSRAGHRPAYARLDEALDVLGGPAVLAVTATAGDEAAAAIKGVLGIETVVLDPTVRSNLMLEDKRTVADKDGYLAALAARGEKTIIYVNSREQSVRLARMLRKRVPDIAMRTAFYNGGLSRSARHAVEAAFRTGDIVLVVATSAFGEGVNIPDIRHVVLYHLPFHDIEFNQMCGRAGRDGAAARIHPLFGEKDGKVNDLVLASSAPHRDDMAALYVELRDACSQCPDGLEITNAELAERVARRRGRSAMNDKGVSSALGVFRELGFIESEGSGSYRLLRMLPATGRKVELSESVRYAEGLEEIVGFEEFRKWALAAQATDLLERVNRPLLPTGDG